MATVTHLYTATIEGVKHYVDEVRSDTYTESAGSCTYRKQFDLQAELPITLNAARTFFALFFRVTNRLQHNGCPIVSLNISHSEEEDLDKLWTAEVEYRGETEDANLEQYKIPYDLRESFETGGGTAHITQAWHTSAQQTGETVYSCDSTDSTIPTTFNGQIGWNGEEAQGCDVIKPAFSFTLHRRVTADEMTTAYRQTLCLLTGCVNDDVYCGFSAGNLLLESVSGTSSAEYKEEDIVIDGEDISWPYRLFYDLTFKFRGGIEYTNFDVGGATIASKKAHQYMWVYSVRQDDSTAGVTLSYPKAVIVNDVYPSADFTLLNIYGEQNP